MSGKTSKDAEEIFSQFEKHKEKGEQPEEKIQQEPQPEPSADVIEEPQQEASVDVTEEPASEPSIDVIEEPTSSSEELDEPQPSKASQEPEIAADEEETAKIRNVIFVGTKPIMVYVTATLTQLASSPTVTIKARGKRITQAVDVSQMIVKRMDSVGYKVTGVRISSDLLTSQDGKKRNVSTIEIDVTKIDDN